MQESLDFVSKTSPMQARALKRMLTILFIAGVELESILIGIKVDLDSAEGTC